MEFTCGKNELQKAVQFVDRIVTTRSTLPIIGNIMFEVEEGKLKLSANNLEIGIEISISAKTKKSGSILIPAKTISQMVGKLPNEEINFKLAENGLINISYRKSKLNIHGLPPDEFPQIPKVKPGKRFKINGKIFYQLIRQTVFSAASSEEKFVLNGILMETGKASFDNTNFRLVATDGYRLAKRGCVIDNMPGGLSIIVPSKALVELSKMIEDKDENIEILSSDEQIMFKLKDFVLVSRLVKGKFPNYKQVIPQPSSLNFKVKTDAFLESLERAGIIAQQSANIVKLEVKEGQLKILATSPDIGNATEVLDVSSNIKEKIQIAFNVRLIIDALKVIDEEAVKFELSGPLNPGVIVPEGSKGFSYIVMPIKTQEVAA